MRQHAPGCSNTGHTVGSASDTHLDLMIQRRPRGFRTLTLEWIAELSKEQLQTAVTKLLGSKPTLVIAGKHPRVPKDRRAPYDRFPGPMTRYAAADLL